MKLNRSYWQDKTVLITGITGFAGSWLAETLLPLGANVVGITKSNGINNVAHLKEKLKVITADILDEKAVFQALKSNEIDVLFHLAAQSDVVRAFKDPVETYSINFGGTLSILEAVRKYDTLEKMHFAGSSQEYGLIYENETPVKETNQLRPMNPYAVAKIAASFACEVHSKSYGIPVVRTRAFNHIGPRQQRHFIVPTIIDQAIQIKNGKRAEFELEDINSQRDFTDVRDMVNGYTLAVEKGENAEVYNLCSGKAHSIKQIIEIVSKKIKISPKVKLNKTKRPNHIPLVLGDCTKAKQDLGFKPEITLEETITELVKTAEASH